MQAIETTLHQSGTHGQPAYSYLHVVSFEETNVMGNVYFARHVAWQGRCREMFLREFVPSIDEELATGLRLVTTSVACEYFEEIRAFDAIDIQMKMRRLHQNRLGLEFEYFRIASIATLVARGSQELMCMQQVSKELVPAAFPVALVKAMQSFRLPAGGHNPIHGQRF